MIKVKFLQVILPAILLIILQIYHQPVLAAKQEQKFVPNLAAYRLHIQRVLDYIDESHFLLEELQHFFCNEFGYFPLDSYAIKQDFATIAEKLSSAYSHSLGEFTFSTVIADGMSLEYLHNPSDWQQSSQCRH